jgi:hypothetical protein
MTMDLRAFALILDQGRRAASAIEDAPLAATLSAMCETAINYHLAEERAAALDLNNPSGRRVTSQERDDARGIWNIAADFAAPAADH